jgi:uncharacterized protein (DUF779 family)
LILVCSRSESATFRESEIVLVPPEVCQQSDGAGSAPFFLRARLSKQANREQAMTAPARVEATREAVVWIGVLKGKHGPLAFYQGHGCNEGGAAPVCLPEGEYRSAPDDRLLGEIGGCPFYASGHQFEQWRRVQAIVDVAPGLGAGFSLEAPEGVGFFTRLRLLSDEEIEQLAAKGEPPLAA